MSSNYWRSPGPFVPKEKKAQEQYLKELLFAANNNIPHPAIKKASERVNDERMGQLNHKAASNTPLPQHMQEQRAEEERQAWKDYWSTHSKEHDHYRGNAPHRRHGGIWTGD
ncbi:hypothetical protein ABLA30_22810 [Xenorhabdus nematophila]|uniref:hypothetical protein n=1 Tax=Xenorhabdus nematophila TaxID=628 RepID=UPI0032B8671F